jgi:hypothetical protein
MLSFSSGRAAPAEPAELTTAAATNEIARSARFRPNGIPAVCRSELKGG